MKSKLYVDEAVENKSSKTTADNYYYPCNIVIRGTTHSALFTYNQLDVAVKRACRNPEDIPAAKSFWSKLWSGELW